LFKTQKENSEKTKKTDLPATQLAQSFGFAPGQLKIEAIKKEIPKNFLVKIGDELCIDLSKVSRFHRSITIDMSNSNTLPLIDLIIIDYELYNDESGKPKKRPMVVSTGVTTTETDKIKGTCRVILGENTSFDLTNIPRSFERYDFRFGKSGVTEKQLHKFYTFFKTMKKSVELMPVYTLYLDTDASILDQRIFDPVILGDHKVQFNIFSNTVRGNLKDAIIKLGIEPSDFGGNREILAPGNYSSLIDFQNVLLDRNLDAWADFLE
jgi:hypothetical protein